MKLIHCPDIGERPVSEFVYGGEVRQPPNPSEASDHEWADYVYNRNSAPGIKREWWCHAPSGMWFVLERNTMTDEFISLVSPQEVQYEL